MRSASCLVNMTKSLKPKSDLASQQKNRRSHPRRFFCCAQHAELAWAERVTGDLSCLKAAAGEVSGFLGHTEEVRFKPA